MSAEPRILLLRGVNVGAHRKLPMADLRAVLEGLGLERVQTHIQSGNAVFRDPLDRAGLAGQIAQALGARLAFTPEALVLALTALEAVLAANPYAAEGAGDGGSTVHIGFLARPSAVEPALLTALAAPGERCSLTDAAVYLHAPDGIGRSKLAAGAERLLKVPMTMRNQRVAEAIATLARTLTRESR